MPAMFCNQCGAQNAPDARFCSRCGAAFGEIAQSPMASPPSVPAYTSPQIMTPLPAGYGGFWIRFVAFIIDLIVVQIVILPVSFVILAIGGLAGRLSGDLAFSGLWTLGLAACALFGGGVNWI